MRAMTVAELIEELNKLPQDAYVIGKIKGVKNDRYGVHDLNSAKMLVDLKEVEVQWVEKTAQPKLVRMYFEYL